MSEYIKRKRIGLADVTNTYCRTCRKVIHREEVWPDGKIYQKDWECNCNNQKTLEEYAKNEIQERNEKIRDLVDWGFHDKVRQEDTFEKDRFRYSPDDQLKLIKNYAEHFVDEYYPRGLGMLFVGLSGRGKTFRTSNIANYIVDHYLMYVLYYPMSELVYRVNDFATRDEMLRKIRVADLVIIDDFKLGNQRQNDAAYEIINARYSTGKPMIISTNIEPKELQAETDIEKVRIYQRIIQKCSCVLAFTQTEDMRTVIAKENFEEFMRIFNKDRE